MSKVVVIDQGNHGTIEQDLLSKLICKRFQPHERHFAQLEFDYLTRFKAALVGHPYLDCPDPVSVDPDNGLVWMTFCSGSRLDRYLADADAQIDGHLKHLAEQIALALQLYIQVFEEPYYDLATKHVLYNPGSRVLSLVDFSGARRFEEFSPREAPLEVSLGIFLGRTTWDTVKPLHVMNRDYGIRQNRLSTDILNNLTMDKDLQWSLIRRVCTHEFEFRAYSKSPAYQCWYRTGGRVWFHRRIDAILGSQRDTERTN